MTPEVAVTKLAEIAAARPELSEDGLYEALTAAGVPPELADRAYKFTQIAWGRTFLGGLGVRFSRHYLCFDAEGAVVESGELSEEPCFAAATRALELFYRTPAFQRLALTSADVHAVNNALNAGSKPENLVTAPAFVFLAAPTPAGLQKAQGVIAEHMAALRDAPQDAPASNVD